MFKVVVFPLHTGLVEAVTVGTVGFVQAMQLNVQANGSVKGVTSFVVQLAELKIAVLKFAGESFVTTQLYMALSTSGEIPNELVAFRAAGKVEALGEVGHWPSVASQRFPPSTFMLIPVINVGAAKVP